ncbi:MAG: aldehyde dehydrogenase family protein [Thermoanaerobaculaceae bacterium]|jgi:aldehyde dehydrogenase (NAD+)|nr:aldehyde dehydrogenase family protein [Thermoanaerobaculaceae bacterium]
MDLTHLFRTFGLHETNAGAYAGAWIEGRGELLQSLNPATGETLAGVWQADVAAGERVIRTADETFRWWRSVPAPRRGELVHDLGNQLRAHKQALGRLISLEMGKILSEGLGEVQEMIDMCDFAVGLSRQLYGITMPSERPGHRLSEQWHPLGPVAVITAFNFPTAVWAWNAAVAAVCGDTVIWKPSSHTPLTALAVQHICNHVACRHKAEGVFNLVIGPGREIGQRLVEDPRVPLVSFTGSTGQGRRVASTVASRFGRSILELGGNNAVVVMDDADLDMALRAIVFAAVGTAGQRCTSLRRLIVHERVHDQLVERLVRALRSVPIGDPLAEGTLMGPLVSEEAVTDYLKALDRVRAEGGTILTGGRRVERPGNFVEPTLVAAGRDLAIAHEETFAPILYVYRVSGLEEAIAVNNEVAQGLSSAIFTTSVLSAERFLSVEGSDCGIANVNIGTSGAEIGGAFGGEKETGGGREAGSDAWKAYMRRQTCTVNYSAQLPLAQGVEFDLS